MAALLLFILGAGLLVGGVALLSVPVALVVAGVLVLTVAVLVDLNTRSVPPVEVAE